MSSSLSLDGRLIFFPLSLTLSSSAFFFLELSSNELEQLAPAGQIPGLRSTVFKFLPPEALSPP